LRLVATLSLPETLSIDQWLGGGGGSGGGLRIAGNNKGTAAINKGIAITDKGGLVILPNCACLAETLVTRGIRAMLRCKGGSNINMTP